MCGHRSRVGICGALVAVAWVTVLVLTPAVPFSAAAPNPAAPPGRKILVDATDTVTLKDLTERGAARLVDYGSFALWSVPEAQFKELLSRPGVTPGDNFDTIGLRGTVIPTQAGEPEVAANLRQARTKEPQFWMVQFIGPVKDGWLQELEGLGLQIVMYMPSNAYVVWGDGGSLEKLDRLAAKSSFIQWTGAYQPAYRLEPALQEAVRSRSAEQMVDVTVQVYNTEAVEQSVAKLEALGGRVHKRPGTVLNFTDISLQIPAGQLTTVANWPDVYNVEPYAPPKILDEVQGVILSGNVTTVGGNVVPGGPGYLAWLGGKGFPTTQSSYPIVDVVDTGIDQGDVSNVLHPDFHEFGMLSNTVRLAYISTCTADPKGNDLFGHGNLNAGIIGSYNNRTGSPHQDANGYRIGLGMSPYGRIAGTKIFRNSDLEWDVSQCSGTDPGVVAHSYNLGAAMTSNSWGYGVRGTYDAPAQAYDALTRDASSETPGNQQMLHIFAAGNAGPQPTSINSPATGKNVLAVGSTESVRDNGVADGCGVSDADNADDVFEGSSRGLTADWRSKPDLMAPGVHIQGPASQDPHYNGWALCNKYYPSGQTLYTWSQGTSHSAPAVSGAASLLYEYYGRVLMPGQNPSPAMIKALLINSARYLTGADANDTLPSPNQGWGDVNLGLLFDGTARYMLDQSMVFGSTGQVYTVTGSIADVNKPFRVSLVWTDAPGSTTGFSYVNDLDLEVTVGGSVYKGNVFSGASSTAGDSFDPRNNVENVFLPAGVSGGFQARVIARNIPGDGIPGNADPTDQDFALVIYNYDSASVPVLGRSGLRWSETLGNHNGIIDPGETIALQIDLTNYGTQAAIGVNGVVAAIGGPATMIDNMSAYPDIAGGAVTTNDTPYAFQVSPSAMCGDHLAFQQTVTYGASQTLTHTFTLFVGSPVAGSLTNYPYTGGPVPIPDNSPMGATATINIMAGGVISDIMAHVDVTHNRDEDLQLLLTSPNETTVQLSYQNGGSGHDYIGTILADGVMTSVVDGAAPFTGWFRPERPLMALAGEAISGTWTLKVVDSQAGITGTIGGFSLDILPVTYTCEAQLFFSMDISKEVYPDLVQPGGTVTYTVHLTNTGNVDLHAVVTDTLPDHVSPTGDITWTTPITASGGTWTQPFTVTVGWGYAGMLTNTVQVKAESQATGAYTVTSQVRPVPALVVTKVGYPSSIMSGGTVTYTIHLTNTGSAELTATITDTYPEHGTLSGSETWTTTLTAPGGFWTRALVFTVDSSYSGTLTNTVEVTTGEGASGRAVAVVTSEAPGHPIYLPIIRKAGGTGGYGPAASRRVEPCVRWRFWETSHPRTKSQTPDPSVVNQVVHTNTTVTVHGGFKTRSVS